ncbi:MAG: ribosome-associated translation inhibitor RaiA [Deltaproteobacteria bacterium]|nr:ribosome-associated translation inhibitor RaiA [Deltaproteobacteria bacterium]
MTFKHMDATEALKTHVNEKTAKILKFLKGEVEANWVFYLAGDEHVADLRIQGPRIDYFGQARTENMYHSIDAAIVKIEKQLKKHKEILKDHIHRERKAADKVNGGGGKTKAADDSEE